jgi:hypothetical protein
MVVVDGIEALTNQLKEIIREIDKSLASPEFDVIFRYKLNN